MSVKAHKMKRMIDQPVIRFKDLNCGNISALKSMIVERPVLHGKKMTGGVHLDPNSPFLTPVSFRNDLKVWVYQ